MSADILQPHFMCPHKARAFLEALRWPNGPVCPHCGVVRVDHYAINGKRTRPGLRECKDCRKEFTVTVGTIFESSKVPLNKWLLVNHLMCASKKAISAHQVHRMVGISYKTAWFMCHRVREAMSSGHSLLGTSGSVVEADETYWGLEPGKTRKMGYQHMMKILSLVDREGEKRSFHVRDSSTEATAEIFKTHVSPNAILNTDSAHRFKKIGANFAGHSMVNHSKKQYARKGVTVNRAESSFSLLKRGLIGTFHHVSGKHMQRYVTEFDFRWNYRKEKDADRATALLLRIQGKRITYRTPKRAKALPLV